MINKSENIANLAKALSAFQGEVSNPANTANNPFFKSKYAPLSEVLSSCRILLENMAYLLFKFQAAEAIAMYL